MADGSKTQRRRERCTDEDAYHLDRAAKRLAGAFGYGAAWRAEVHEGPNFSEAAARGEEPVGGSQLSIGVRARVVEGAGKSIRGSRHVRAQHAWTIVRGVAATPLAQPDPLGVAALTFAQLKGPREPLLLAYALQSMPHWMKVEPYLHAMLPTDHRIIAGRDAMARIMYARAATSIEERAWQLHLRVAVYRAETRNAESLLLEWLAQSARAYNVVANARSERAYGTRASLNLPLTFWNETEYQKTLQGTGLFPANHLNSRSIARRYSGNGLPKIVERQRRALVAA